MIDYHIHTNHSIDAEGELEDYCKKALSIGLKEICFTNHCELDPARNDSFICFNGQREKFTRQGLLCLRDEIEKQRIKYQKSGLNIKFGIEVGYYNAIDSVLKEITDGVELDFVLGSIHCLDHICIDSSREYMDYFPNHSAHSMLTNYFQAVEDLVKSNLFNAVGHLDVYKKYGISYYKERVHEVLETPLREIYNTMAEHNIALEINTAGLRRIDQFYPAPSIIKYARAQGLKMITIGSDAHRVSDLGKGISEGLAYAKSFGFDTVYRFDKKQPIGMNI
ncbi:MAG: histidinol-phosphatase HisJ family protein [bacterium]